MSIYQETFLPRGSCPYLYREILPAAPASSAADAFDSITMGQQSFFPCMTDNERFFATLANHGLSFRLETLAAVLLDASGMFPYAPIFILLPLPCRLPWVRQ